MTRTDTSAPGKSSGKQLMNELYGYTSRGAAEEGIWSGAWLSHCENIRKRTERTMRCFGELCSVRVVLSKRWFGLIHACACLWF